MIRACPCRDTEVVSPSAVNDNVTEPALTNRVGRPNRFASGGSRAIAVSPSLAKTREPSADSVFFAGPEVLALIVFPVLRLVKVV